MFKFFTFITFSCLMFYSVYYSFNTNKNIEYQLTSVATDKNVDSNYVIVDNEKNNAVENKIIENKIIEKELMTIEIPKINIFGKIYNKNSKLNNIDKNIFIVDESDYPNEKKGTVIIGAHSGIGELAYFKYLNKLVIGDYIYLNYNDSVYTYKVINTYLDSKNGSISINYNPNDSKLILFTCNPNDKANYLVVVCEKI